MPYTLDWDALRQDAVATLSRYVRFDTTNPPGNELPAALWLRDEIVRRGISQDVALYEPASGRGLLIARIPGSEPLKPLLLNHHIDVVAADPCRWTYPPFEGVVSDGFVWGRGTLDTKSLGIIFMLALQELLKEGVSFRRPVIFLAVPDEETGGKNGMRWLVERHLAELDPAWVWDEGGGGIRGVFGKAAFFGIAVVERQIQHLRLIATGTPGHGSMPHANNACIILLRALERILSSPRPMRLNGVTAEMFRVWGRGQKFPRSMLRLLAHPLFLRLAGRRLSTDKWLNAMLRDTISLTVLRAGYKVNVIPERAEAEIDCRLMPDTDAAEFHHWLHERIADERIRVEVMESSPPSGVSPLDSAFYRAAVRAIERHIPGSIVFPLLMTGATDGRYFRQRGYPTYGLGPIVLEREDVSRNHGVDERISCENLVLGIQIARDIIRELCVGVFG